MSKDTIHCKIELIKDSSTGQMTLTAHLNPQAANIQVDEQTISWTPTHEEQQFLIDAIGLIQKQKHQPLVTFTKKTNENTQTNIDNTTETIDSINQTIDNLPSTQQHKNQNDLHTSATIEEIIKQNTKQE